MTYSVSIVRSKEDGGSEFVGEGSWTPWGPLEINSVPEDVHAIFEYFTMQADDENKIAPTHHVHVPSGDYRITFSKRSVLKVA